MNYYLLFIIFHFLHFSFLITSVIYMNSAQSADAAMRALQGKLIEGEHISLTKMTSNVVCFYL